MEKALQHEYEDIFEEKPSLILMSKTKQNSSSTKKPSVPSSVCK
jgi:hypothetical protein